MAAVGKPISHELGTAWQPEEMTRYVALKAGGIGAFGYRIEQRTPSTVVLARRYTPTIVWALPLGIATLSFIVGTAAPGATIETAEAAGKVARIALIAAFVLWLVVKSTERVTIVATAEGIGSRVIFSGTATPKFRNYIASWPIPAPVPATSAEPSTSSR